MTSLLLHKTGSLALASRGRVIKRDQFALLGNAVAVMDSLEQVRVQIDSRAAEAREEGHRSGYEQGRHEGYAAGWSQAQESVAQKIAALDHTLAAERAQRDAQVTDLALAIVARVARDVGSPGMMAGLVSKALDDLKGDAPVRIRVNQANYDAIHARLGHSGREVSLAIDDQLGPYDCEFDTQGGHLDVGLAEQLEIIRGALHGRRVELDLAA